MPWVVLTVYGVLVSDYARHLYANLDLRPHLPGAVEDILGFGFWPTWTVVFVLLALFGALAYRNATKRSAYFLPLLAVFVGGSVLDYVLYRTLFKQLL